MLRRGKGRFLFRNIYTGVLNLAFRPCFGFRLCRFEIRAQTPGRFITSKKASDDPLHPGRGSGPDFVVKLDGNLFSIILVAPRPRLLAAFVWLQNRVQKVFVEIACVLEGSKLLISEEPLAVFPDHELVAESQTREVRHFHPYFDIDGVLVDAALHYLLSAHPAPSTCANDGTITGATAASSIIITQSAI